MSGNTNWNVEVFNVFWILFFLPLSRATMHDQHNVSATYIVQYSIMYCTYIQT